MKVLNKKEGQMTSLVPAERVESRILFIRGQKVLLDNDLAALYEVEVRTLNQAVTRNLDRFPDDFMFQLTETEWESCLRSQVVILKTGRGQHRKFLPRAYTEQGVAMLSTVLKSKRAIYVNIQIMRAFVRLRHIMAANNDLSRKLVDMEKKYDYQFRIVFEVIDQLMEPEELLREEKPNFTKVKGFGP